MADLDNPVTMSSPTDRCREGLDEMRDLAQRFLRDVGHPMFFAKQMFEVGFEHGGWSVEQECPQLSEATPTFLQLFEAIEVHQDNAESMAAYGKLTHEAAEAFLNRAPFPQWQDRGDAVPWRPEGN